MEAFLGAFDKGFVGLHLFIDGQSHENDNQTEQKKTADKEACGSDGFGGQVAEVDHKGDDGGGKSSEPCDRYRIL